MTQTTGVAADITRVEKMLKIAYADNPADVLPKKFNTLSDSIKLISKEKGPGNKFYQPVPTSISGGFTYNRDGSVITLNQGISPEVLNAELTGAEIIGREFISYSALNRAAKGKQAFIDGLDHIVKSLGAGAAKRRAAALWYGGGASPTGALGALGVIEAVTGSSGTTLVATITDETFSPSLWIGMKSHEFDIYDAADGTTKNNTNGSDTTAVFVATGQVDVSTRKVYFTSHASNVSAIAAGDFIKFAGAHDKDCLGFQGMFSVSTLHNIATTNASWKPQTYAVNGRLTWGKLQEGLEMLQDFGYEGELDLFVPGRSYRQLMDDQAAFVSYANSGKGPGGGKLSVGYDDIEFNGPCGKVRVKKEMLMWRGRAYGLPLSECMRIGPSDLTFTQPGVGRLLIDIPDKNAVQLKMWSEQAPYCEYPCGMLQFTGISA